MITTEKSSPMRPPGWVLLFCAFVPVVSAADIQTNAPAGPVIRKISFDHDIQPIFAASCLRCHGPEKPRSHFRLDNRASVLQGGNDNTNDVVPGDPTKSLLLSYVARQVPAMEMPPAGRGEPLTPLQIDLLRVWILQGANWSVTNQGPQSDLQIEATAGGIGVHGNAAKFRELENTTDGAAGGVKDFSWREQINANEKLTVTGQVDGPNQDYKFNLALDETDRGFVHAGFDQWRKYYDSSGGYNALAVPQDFNLNQDSYVDSGRFWADLGLTLPKLPEFVLGYEYQYRQGNEATLDWGNAASQNTHLYPATQSLNEGTHVIKFDVSQNVNDWELADSARVEFYREANRGAESSFFTTGGSSFSSFLNTQDNYNDVQGMNTLTLNKQLRDWWHLSGGVYYSKLEGTDLFNQPQSALASQAITLERESEIFSVASLFTPLKHLDVSLGSQNEWTRENGFGSSVPDLNLFANTPAWSSEDTFKASQNAGLHFTQIPFTALFAEAQFQEENVSENQTEDAGGPDGFLRQTEYFDLHRDIRAGFNTSPWRWFSLNVQYHNQSSDTEYHNLADISEGLPVALTNGYPGFMLDRDISGNGLETKLVLRPSGWWSATLTGNLTATDYKSNTDPAFDPVLAEIVTPGGPILDGRSRDQTYGLSTTLAPWHSFYFTSALTFSDTRLSTADNSDASVEPYHGDTWTLSSTATCAMNPKTTLQASYIFTRADYNQNTSAPALPYGLDFTRHQVTIGITRQFSQRLSGALHYEYSQYTEPGVPSLNDFVAQGVFASISYKWP